LVLFVRFVHFFFDFVDVRVRVLRRRGAALSLGAAAAYSRSSGTKTSSSLRLAVVLEDLGKAERSEAKVVGMANSRMAESKKTASRGPKSARRPAIAREEVLKRST
jgi:hypothetical protein